MFDVQSVRCSMFSLFDVRCSVYLKSNMYLLVETLKGGILCHRKLFGTMPTDRHEAAHESYYVEETILVDLFSPPHKELMEKGKGFAPDPKILDLVDWAE